MDVTSLDTAADLLARTPAVDMHVHGRTIAPEWLRFFGERLLAVPGERVSAMVDAPLNLAVVTAVGDFLGTAWRPRSEWRAVLHQVEAARREATDGGLDVVASTEQMNNRSAVMLGLEGGDVLGADPHRLHELYRCGIRVLGLVHYADNALGTTASTLSGRTGSRAVRRGERAAGLTVLGREVVCEMNRLGMLIDLAHADFATTMAVCESSSAPVICSHTGASAVQQFARYISDDEVCAIAATGGLVGLWPARLRGMAMTDTDDFIRHAAHLADLVGTERLCIGTDMNGVPGYINGYTGHEDLPALAAALLRGGFSTVDVQNVMGRNALRLLSETLRTP